MKTKEAIEKLKSEIKNVYNITRCNLGNNIYRGHSRSISADIEDKLALFISSLLPSGYKIFIDPSIHIERKTHRPDCLVINNSNEIVAMIEIKANMGWCRNAENVIENIVSNDAIFKQANLISCEFSNNGTIDVKYGAIAKLFLVSLTKGNCSDKNHSCNKAFAEKNRVEHFNLFDGWYDSLVDYEIENFANCIMVL